MSGKWGLGYFNTDAPVGVRVWATPALGIDIGVGFESVENYWYDPETEPENPEKVNATSFWFEVGFPYIVFPSERANFFLRPGFQLGMIDDRNFGFWDDTGFDAKWTIMTFSLTPGAEVFIGENFAIEAGHGIALEITSQPDELGGESFTDIRTFDASLAYLGFHFYFK
jgi:hypothetical protein